MDIAGNSDYPGRAWPGTTLVGQLLPEAQRALLGLGTRRSFDPGEVVLLEGSPSNCVVVLLRGLFKVVGSLGSGREAFLAVRVGGDIVGELGLADGGPRSATVKAVGYGTGRRIGERDFRAFTDCFADARRAMDRTVAAKLRSATRRRVELATRPPAARLASVLREFVESHGVQADEGIVIKVALTQAELAALIGVAEPTVHRALTALRQDGVLETRYRRIVVRDLRRLDEIARA